MIRIFVLLHLQPADIMCTGAALLRYQIPWSAYVHIGMSTAKPHKDADTQDIPQLASLTQE